MSIELVLEVLGAISALCAWIFVGYTLAKDKHDEPLPNQPSSNLAKEFLIGFVATPIIGVVLVIIGALGVWLITPLIVLSSLLFSFFM